MANRRVAFMAVVTGVLFLAAVARLQAWGPFIAATESLSLPGPGLRNAATVLVPPLEAAALAWYSLALLGVFSGVIAWHSLSAVPPRCACLGMWSQYIRADESARAMLLRNGVLISVGLVSVVPSRKRPTMPQAGESTAHGGRGMARAFTLVELLAALAIIGVLSALLVGVIASVNRDGRRSATLSRLRTHGAAFSAYSVDHRSMFPFFTNHGFASTTLVGGGIRLEGASFFDAHRTWHIALADDYYGLRADADVFCPPMYRAERATFWPLHTPYHYGCVFITRPEYWSERTRAGREQMRQTRSEEVLFPASKSLIIESWPFVERMVDPRRRWTEQLPMVLCDGATASVGPRRIEPGYPRGDGYLLNGTQVGGDGAIHWNDSPPCLHTIDGVRGRDVR